MTVPTVSWNENSPAGSDNASAGDDRIREAKTQIREVIDVDHDFPSSGQATDVGQHKKVTLQEQADLGTGAANATLLGGQTYSGKEELTYTDEDDNDIILTSLGKIGHSTISGVVDDLTVIGAATVAETLVVTGVATLGDGSLLATSAAPSTDAMIANKKYVDDNIKDIVGTAASKSFGTDYQAATAGFVQGYVQAGGGAGYEAYTDANTTPTTLVQKSIQGATDQAEAVPIGFMVKKDDYYRVDITLQTGGGDASALYFVPLT